MQRADSYVRKLRHDNLQEIEREIKKYFSAETEYFLGIRQTEIFESSHPSEAALYAVRGRLKNAENKL